jgi:hypothetical protein
MKRFVLKPLALAVGLALVGPASAVTLDFGGSNIYMKFLDGDRRVVNANKISGDTASGTDNGQWTEFELRIKATISPQVEAGVRLQSRSSSAYWTDFGFADEKEPNKSKFVKLRGAYVLLTPGYNWLNTALIGSSDWGYFDPFTVGKVRYIDRDNYNGLYFKGPTYFGGTWEAARVSLPNYLQANYGQGSACCNTDSTQFNEAVYIGQFKMPIGPVKLTASYQQFNDHETDPLDTNPADGSNRKTFSKNRVAALKADFTPVDGIDVRGAYYRSSYITTGVFDQAFINSPKSSIGDRAFKLDVDFSNLPVPGLSLNAQYFNIGAGYYSNTAARRESDVLLTEGSESAWYNWGNPIAGIRNIWLGGAAKDYQQSPSAPNNDRFDGSAPNGLTDNAFMDFDEAPAESVLGWKGITLVANYEVFKTPMSLEFSTIGYNSDRQAYSPTGPLANYYPLNSDRKTNIIAFKVSHVFPILGGLETSFKAKRVVDKDKGDLSTLVASNDDRETKDTGYTLAVGNQVFSDLYASLSYGKYKRDVKFGAASFDNSKDIWSLRTSYNLSGLEIGGLAQWIKGTGDPTQAGNQIDFKQYRLKAFVKAIF